MKKTKSLIFLFLSIVLLVVMIPNTSNAATIYTYSDTEQGIEWSYELDSNNNAINLKCTTTTVSGAVTIPDSVDGYTVISLSETFNGYVGIISVTIPDSVTTIGDYVFYNCTGLTSVTLSESLISIGNYAFSGCTGLTSITIPNSVTTIGNYAFRNCSGLTSVTLPENLTTISTGTFLKCTGLTNIIIPESVTTISGAAAAGAFHGCTNLKKILIPDSVVSITEYTFTDCDNLTIYGNEGSYAQSYASDNDIPFDYISNWDSSDTGSDITAPTVERIEVLYTSVLGNYDTNTSYFVVSTGDTLTIEVEFSEEITGTTVPTLTIKFGSGSERTLTEGTISGDNIIYSYTIQSDDLGAMSTVSYVGGDIEDTSGNSAELSCPTLRIEYYGSSWYVYANGTVTSDDGDTTDGSSSSGSDTSGSSSTDGSSSSTDGTTISASTLPQTGVSSAILMAMVIIAVIGTVLYVNYRKVKDID